jgi:hypothetical protein
LLELNVSGNNLKRLSPQQLAPMCQLHWLDLKGNRELSDGYSCDCHLLKSWIADRNIVLQSQYKLDCTSDQHGKALFIGFLCRNMVHVTDTFLRTLPIVMKEVLCPMLKTVYFINTEHFFIFLIYLVSLESAGREIFTAI